MRTAVLVACLLSLANPAGAAKPGFWEGVIHPERAEVEKLVARAQAELEDRLERSLGRISAQSAARAVSMLEQALRLDPRHFLATLLLAEAYAAQGASPKAVSTFSRACALAATRDDEGACTLRLAVERSKAGRYAEALDDYERHIRLGGAQAAAYANSAEILMALGRLAEAAERYRTAIRLEELSRPGRARDEGLALAHYGLAVTLDRDDKPGPSREAMSRALALDPKIALLDAARDGRSDVFFVPAGDVHYYRGLALEVLGRRAEAADAFRRFTEEVPGSRYARRADAHRRALTAEEKPAPAATKFSYRVAAAATVRTDGPLPAPLVDAAWKNQPRLFEPCFENLTTAGKPTVRVGIELTVDAQGGVSKVVPELPEDWRESAACLQRRLPPALRFSRPSKPKPTSVRIELVLSLQGQ